MYHSLKKDCDFIHFYSYQLTKTKPSLPNRERKAYIRYSEARQLNSQLSKPIPLGIPVANGLYVSCTVLCCLDFLLSFQNQPVAFLALPDSKSPSLSGCPGRITAQPDLEGLTDCGPPA